jgi:hypothetical protein
LCHQNKILISAANFLLFENYFFFCIFDSDIIAIGFVNHSRTVDRLDIPRTTKAAMGTTTETKAVIPTTVMTNRATVLSIPDTEHLEVQLHLHTTADIHHTLHADLLHLLNNIPSPIPVLRHHQGHRHILMAVTVDHTIIPICIIIRSSSNEVHIHHHHRDISHKLRETGSMHWLERHLLATQIEGEEAIDLISTLSTRTLTSKKKSFKEKPILICRSLCAVRRSFFLFFLKFDLI